MSKQFQNTLQRLGVDMSSSHMHVFQAILTAAGGSNKSVTYTEIAGSLETIAKKKYTRAYVYRQLNALEESGFINTHPGLSSRSYTITETSVGAALEAKRRRQLDSHEIEKKDLISKIDHLEAVKSQELALMFHNQLAGVSEIDRSLVIAGIENVRSTIIREFAEKAQEGDRIRILAHASTILSGLGPGGVTELKLIQTALRGVKVHALLTTSGVDALNVDLLAGYLRPIVEMVDQVAKSGNFLFKISQKPINTYRIVSLNEDKMLLYLTHAKDSDMAALVHRKDNPGLIDDAIRTFDELMETGIDTRDLMKQSSKKAQASKN